VATTDKKNFRASSSVYVCGICIYLYVYVLYCFSSRGNYSLGRLFEIQLPASILILMRRGIFVSHLFRLLVHSFIRSCSYSHSPPSLFHTHSCICAVSFFLVVIWASIYIFFSVFWLLFFRVFSCHRIAAYIIMRTGDASVSVSIFIPIFIYLWQVVVAIKCALDSKLLLLKYAPPLAKYVDIR